MRGSIIGDIIGSTYLDSPQETPGFQLLKPFSAYTDDTVLLLATADAICNRIPYDVALRNWVRKFPKAGYNDEFLDWALSNKPCNEYDSEGDGAARRIAPIGFAATSLEEALYEARKSTIITHSLEAKIVASQAVAGSIFLAKDGHSKDQIRTFIKQKFGYVLNGFLTVEYASELTERYNSPVPAALLAFLASTDYEDAVRKAICLGGATNTIACITGGIAQAYYRHIPKALTRKTLSRCTFDMNELIDLFESRYDITEETFSGQLAPLSFH